MYKKATDIEESTLKYNQINIIGHELLRNVVNVVKMVKFDAIVVDEFTSMLGKSGNVMYKNFEKLQARNICVLSGL